MNRPLVWIAAAFTAGIYAGSSGMSGGWIPPLLLCVAVLAAMPLWRHPQYRAFSVVLLFAGAGMLLWEVRHDGPAGDSLSRYVASHPEATYQFEGRVRRPDLLVPGQERFSFFFEVDRVLSEDGPEAVHGMVYVRWQAPESPVYADDRLRITAPLELRLSEVNPGVEGFEDYLRRLGVHTKAHIWQAGAVERLAPGRWWCIPYWAARLRNIEAVYLSKTV
ncbi:MAG: internalization-related competence protein ComEC/Rec2, partial [Candidatus Hydrogenedentes bacterium]|nr:internalization-related competence protein ComEC/Rec2 [Candidatus Hydrogenedentota bacterium]